MKNLKLNIFFIIVICGIVLYFSLKDNFNYIIKELYEVNFWWLILACILMFLYFAFRAIEMHALIKRVDSEYPYRKALGLVLLGQFFANVTPSSIGGQPSQVYLLTKDKIRGSRATGIIVQYNATYQISLIIVGLSLILISSLNIFNTLNILFLKELVYISLLIHVFVFIMLVGVNFSKKSNKILMKKIIQILSFFRIIKDKEESIEKWNEIIHDFHDGSHELFKNRRLLFKGIITNVIALICFYSVAYILVFSVRTDINISYFNSLVASSYTNLVSSFMPSPGGAGGFEYFFIQYFRDFITNPTITTVMLLWRFVTYYFIIGIGALMLIFYKEGSVK